MDGIGVNIMKLFGDYGAEHVQAAIGKRIKALSMVDNSLWFEMDGAPSFKLRDGGQSCCESRYMVCDDNLAAHVDAELRNIEVRDAPDQVDEYGESHEIQFLVVTTSHGQFTCSNHNEHNGYYGGFLIMAAPA